MTATTVAIRLYRPGPLGDTDIPAEGYVECVPTRRRNSSTNVILPARYTTRLGEPLLDADGTTILQPATPGVAWAKLEATDAGAYADQWAWRFTERTAGGTRRYCPVPTSVAVVEYTALTDVDPATFDPEAAPDPAWLAALTTEQTTRSNADTALDTRLDTIEGTYATDAELAAEATLARNADNLTSGTVADARIASTITRDTEVGALVAAELVTYQPGLEIGYAERTTSATSTQTAANATGTISGLSVTVTGAGRAVDIRFACPLAWQSTANKLVFTSLMVNGTAGGAAHGSSSPLTTTGPGQTWSRRMVLTNGVSYTFTVALYTEAGGGTATAFANATYPMSLSVTNR